MTRRRAAPRDRDLRTYCRGGVHTHQHRGVPPCQRPAGCARTFTKQVKVRAVRKLTTITAPNPPAARRRSRDARSFADGFVGRAELVARVLEAPNAKLVLIVAPAGYGKSTLLAEWAHCDPRRFIAIAPVGGDHVDGVVQRALEDAAGLETVFVIEDAHSVPALALRQVAAAMLAELGPGSQLAIASRTEPSLPIARLRAQRELVEIRIEDLAMSPAEAATLVRLAGVELDFASVQALSRQTEGWPAGLYLAALSLREHDDVRGALRGFAGDDHFVAEYFRDEVLAALSRKRARFLTRASVLDELSGPLCDAVLEQTSAAGELDELARSGLVVSSPHHRHITANGNRSCRR